MTKRKKIAISLTAVAVLITVTFIVLFFTIGHWRLFYIMGDPDFSAYDREKILSEKEIEKDRSKIIKMTERTHPYFVIEEDHTRYEQNKELFLNAEIETALDFFMEASRYMAFFDDMHTEAILTRATLIPLPEDMYYDSYRQKMIVREEGLLYELAAVNGVEYDEILQGAFPYIPLENQHSMVMTAYYPFTTDYLSRLNVPIYEGYAEYVLVDGEGNRFTSVYPKESAHSAPTQASKQKAPSFFAEVQEGGVLYIRSRSCVDDGTFNDTLNTVKQAIASGTKKVIFDVRGNTGGSDRYMYDILDVFGMGYSYCGGVMRFSTTTFLRFGTLKTRGSIESQFYKGTNSNPKQIDLKIVCDEMTFSAGTAPIFVIKYSKLGEIVGRASGQKPNFCGNVLYFQLKHSKVVYRIPTGSNHWEIDGERVGNVCDVDIFVPYGEDPMDYIVFQ